MSSNDPEDDPPPPPSELFPFDEMSTGETSSLVRRAQVVTGAPDRPVQKPPQPELKPMTGAQLAFRPSAPPRTNASGKSATGSFSAFKPSAPERPGTGAHPALKPSSPERPGTGSFSAFKPSAPERPGTGSFSAFKPPAPERPGSGAHPAVKPATGQQPAYKPASGAHPAVKPATGQQPAFKPGTGPQPAHVPPADAPGEGETPAFDLERLQAQIRAMSITDSALGRAAKGTPKPAKQPVEDTFVKAKMKQAESKVIDLDLDEDLG